MAGILYCDNSAPMKPKILMFLFCAACSSSSGDQQWAEVPTGTSSQTVDTAAGETGDFTPLLEQGKWGMAKPNIESDVCGVDSYQDVLDFVPSAFMIANVNEVGFELDGDYCDLTDSVFSCSELELSESALSGTATLLITSQFSGQIETASLMDTLMEVVINDCQGAGCALIELALTFPCPIELETQAIKL